MKNKKKLCGSSFYINIANFEAFGWTFPLCTNLLFLKSGMLIAVPSMYVAIRKLLHFKAIYLLINMTNYANCRANYHLKYAYAHCYMIYNEFYT